MKVEKNLIEKVANGETSLNGEVVSIAKKIIENDLQSKFKLFAFFYQGDGNEIYDIQDCILDFNLYGSEIKVLYIYPSNSNMRIFGMTVEDSLKRLFNILSQNEKLRENVEGKIFTVNGMTNLFKVSYIALHYCFAKESISVEECLKMMLV